MQACSIDIEIGIISKIKQIIFLIQILNYIFMLLDIIFGVTSVVCQVLTLDLFKSLISFIEEKKIFSYSCTKNHPMIEYYKTILYDLLQYITQLIFKKMNKVNSYTSSNEMLLFIQFIIYIYVMFLLHLVKASVYIKYIYIYKII